MPRPRLAMRKVRDILRLAVGQGLSHRQVGAGGGGPVHHGGRSSAPGPGGGAGLAAARGPGRRGAGGVAVPQGAGAADGGPAAAGVGVHPSRAAPPGGDAHAVVAGVQGVPPGGRLLLQPVLPPLPAVAAASGPGDAPGAPSRGEALRRLPRSAPADLRPADQRGGVRGGAVRGRAGGVELPLRRGGPVPGTGPLDRRPRARLRVLRVTASDRGVRQPPRRRDEGAPLRARHQRHLPGDGRPLRPGHHPDPGRQTPGQGQGRSRGPAGRAVDPGPAAQPALLVAGRGQRSDRRAGGGDQRPAVPQDGRLAAQPVRGAGTAGDAAPARPALRVRPLAAAGQGQHRLPRRGRRPLLLRSLPAGRRSGSTLRFTASTVEVFHSSRRVASHLRSYARGRHTTDPAHMPGRHRRHAEWSPSRIIAWAAPDRTGHRRPRRGHPRGPPPSRAGLPLLPGHHPPR